MEKSESVENLNPIRGGLGATGARGDAPFHHLEFHLILLR